MKKQPRYYFDKSNAFLKNDSLKRKPFVSVVAPVYNEESIISQFLDRLLKVVQGLKEYDFEIILVNDGSQDCSIEIMNEYVLKDERIQVIELARNYGQTAAICAGIDKALGDIIITMDSDLQHFPEEISLFLNKLQEGYDIVCGWRKERKENIMRRWPSFIANRLMRKISNTHINDFGTTFRAYRSEYLKKIELFGDMHRFIPALLSRFGGRITEIPIQNIVRPAGKSNYNISRTFGVIMDLLFLIFYLKYLSRPLRIFGKLAMVLFGIGFSVAFALTFLAYAGIIHGAKEHVALLLFSILMMILGVNFFCYGLISEMQNRIYYKVNDESIYTIRAVWHKKDNHDLARR